MSEEEMVWLELMSGALAGSQFRDPDVMAAWAAKVADAGLKAYLDRFADGDEAPF